MKPSQMTEIAITLLGGLNTTFDADPPCKSEDASEQKYLDRFSALELSGDQAYEKAKFFKAATADSVQFCTAGLRYMEAPEVFMAEQLYRFKRVIEIEIGKASEEANSFKLVARNKAEVYGSFRLIITPERFFHFEQKSNLAFMI